LCYIYLSSIKTFTLTTVTLTKRFYVGAEERETLLLGCDWIEGLGGKGEEGSFFIFKLRIL